MSTTYKRRSQTVSEFLEKLIPVQSIRRMLAHRGYATRVKQAIDGNGNRHLVNASFTLHLNDEGRVIYLGETFCGRHSLALKDVKKKGVTCQGCIHKSRAFLAVRMLGK